MKIVFSSTEEQENQIKELTSNICQHILPYYFTDEEMLRFKKIGVLEPNISHYTYNGTMREAYQVMTCLQVIVSILGEKEKSKSFYKDVKYRKLFERNVALLNEAGIFFPFEYHHFSHPLAETDGMDLYSSEAANQYLI
ncbi:DUF5365 family protein [Bacillus massiliglaciei]|uniref:DUF5365 family protein n=1 Tax=Bacillus massiliglaciei TaxID=1816693 RepID=UPI000DA63B95|nr:DUF5365 family protein [Bacillus massiliglaciei]